MNEKKNKKKAVGVKWSKLQRDLARGGGGGESKDFWLFQYKITRPPSPQGSVIFMTLPTECQFSTLPTLYSASDHPSPLHHPLEALRSS